MTLASRPNRRILVIDDTPARRDAVRALLSAQGFELDVTARGEEALTLLERARGTGRPYALAFVDLQTPPGWDSLETLERLWASDPDLRILLCTASPEHAGGEISWRLGRKEQLLVLKQPFELMEVMQLAECLTQNWTLLQASRAQRAALEVQVRERTAALEVANRRLEDQLEARLAAEAKLQQAQKLAALGGLAAGLMHELNNPLTVVLSNLNYLRAELAALRPSVAKEVADDFEQVLAESFTAATQVKKITRDIQRFAPGAEPRAAEVDVAAALESALTLTLPLLKRVEVERAFEPVAPVFADEGQLIHVFIQLVTSAVQALPEERPRRIQLSTRPAADGAVEIVIAGNGTGVAAAPPDGAISDALVRLLGGELSLESAPGKGTRCRVRLPAAPAEEAPPPVRLEPRPLSARRRMDLPAA